MADALYGTATFVDGTSALFHGVQVISQIRSNQNIRVGKRHQHVADYFATHPGTPCPIRIRGGEVLPGMNAGASTSVVPSPIEGSGTAWVLLGSWALSP